MVHLHPIRNGAASQCSNSSQEEERGEGRSRKQVVCQCSLEVVGGSNQCQGSSLKGCTASRHHHGLRGVSPPQLRGPRRKPSLRVPSPVLVRASVPHDARAVRYLLPSPSWRAPYPMAVRVLCYSLAVRLLAAPARLLARTSPRISARRPSLKVRGRRKQASIIVGWQRGRRRGGMRLILYVRAWRRRDCMRCGRACR